MRPFDTRLLRTTRVAGVAAGLGLLAFALAGSTRAPSMPQAAALCSSTRGMDESGMAAASAAYYRTTPSHGFAATTATAVAADTFLMRNYQFDADHNPATQIDVVHISPGQSVLFKWVAGIHTTTSGNPGDIDSGSLWDLQVDTNHREQLVTFPTPGTYPFQCLFHGDTFFMLGTVIVDNPTPTRSSTWGGVKARYR